MKTNSTSAEILLIALVLAPLAYLGIVWNELSTEIATQYNLSGQPKGWMRKDTFALFTGGLSIIQYLILRFLPSIDPKAKLQTANFQKLRIVVGFFFAAFMSVVIYVADHQVDSKNIMPIVGALVALMVAGMGNYLTTVKPNWFVGIRTPWTLESEVVWRRTHQMGGRLMVAGGLIATVLAFVVPAPYTLGTVVGVILLASLIPVVYSYVYFRQEKAHPLN